MSGNPSITLTVLRVFLCDKDSKTCPRSVRDIFTFTPKRQEKCRVRAEIMPLGETVLNFIITIKRNLHVSLDVWGILQDHDQRLIFE